MHRFFGKILTFAILCQIVCIPARAASSIHADFDMMLATLNEIDVITLEDEQEYDTEATVSRAKFSEYVGKAIHIYPSFSMQYFNDVPHEYEQAEYINALTDCGIISLSDTKLFEPDRPIKYSEACKMLLCAMGYGDYAETVGTPMYNWITVASEADIAISVANQDAITAAEAVELIFNAMSKPVMVKNYDGKTMSIDNNTNLFAQYHDVYFSSGVVEATYGSYLERYQMPMEGKVVINGTEFLSHLDLRHLLGVQVEYVYRWDDDYDEGTIFYAQIRDEDDMLTISSDLLEDYDESTNTFYYLQSKDANKTKRQSIDKNLQIIYNGVPYNGTVTSSISGFLDGTRRGSITLTDSDRNGNFDILIVKNYEIFPQGTIDTINENIYGGFEKTAINYSDFDMVKLFDSKGEERELLDYSDAVLNIAQSENGEVLEIVISEETAEITIKSLQADENEFEDQNGQSYSVDKRVMEQYASTLMSYKSVKVYFDMFGYIVRIEAGATDDYLVGYLIQGKSYEWDHGDTEVQFKIYTRDRKIEKYNFAEKIKIDGISYKMNKDSEAALNSLPKASSYDEEGVIRYKISPQVIRYKLNDDKQITVIDTTNVSVNEDKNNSLVQRHKDASLLNSNRVGLDTYWSAAQTVVFKIPALNDDGKILRNGSYVEPQAKDFGTSVSLSFDYTYNCDTYNYSDTDFYTDVLVVTAEQKILTKEALVFTGTHKMWDEEEDILLTAIECISNGSEITYKLDEGVEKQIEKQGLKYGDIFYISLDGSGQYGTEIKKIFDAETLKFNNGGANDYWYYGAYSPYSNWSYRTGENNRNNLSKMYVLKKRGDAVFGSYEQSELADGIYEEVMRLGSIPVTIVYRDDRKYEKGSFNSILSYEEAGAGAPLILVEHLTQVAKSVIIYQ